MNYEAMITIKLVDYAKLRPAANNINKSSIGFHLIGIQRVKIFSTVLANF